LPQAVKTDLPLRSQGFAVEYYPGYVNRKANPHSLNVVLLSCILRGEGHHLIGDQIFEEHGNSVAVTHYGQRHDIVTDEAGMDVINLYLDLQGHALPSLPRELQEVLPLILPLHPSFLHRLNRIVRIEFEDLKPLGELLFAIAREQASTEPGHEEAARSYLQLFLMECCRRALTKGFARERPPRASSLAKLEKLREYLDQNYEKPHTLEDLARRAGVTRTYLCRTFKRYTGKRVFDYLIERRIQAAMMQLRSSNDKILSVALESGFCDLAYFNRRFRASVGMTPSSYRGLFQKVPAHR
jgi:AraC-like DNA-binding protein